MADISDIATRDLPPKSHNNPPSEVEWLGENLTLRHVHIIRAAEGHVAMVGNIPDHFTAENEASFTSDLIKLMQNCQKELERRRKEEKEPFLRQGQYVDSFFGEMVDRLNTAIMHARRPLEDWLLRKAQAEQAERKRDAQMLHERQEAAIEGAVAAPAGTEARAELVQNAVEVSQQARVADALASAPLTTLGKTAGKGSAAALGTKWAGTIVDIDQLDLNKLRPYLARAELQKALDRYVKQGGRQCDGAQIKEEIDVKVK